MNIFDIPYAFFKFDHINGQRSYTLCGLLLSVPVHCVVFLGKTLTTVVPLSGVVFDWEPANLMLSLTLRWTSIASIVL